MIKLLGVCLIVAGAGGFGVKKAVNFSRQMRQLQDFLRALALLECELNYSLLPVAQLCRTVAEQVHGTVGAFLTNYAAALEKDAPRNSAARSAFARTGGLCLPKEAQIALLELFGTIGRYDLDGENHLLHLTQRRLRTALEDWEREKRPVAKGYAVLGVCTGAALAILLV